MKKFNHIFSGNGLIIAVLGLLCLWSCQKSSIDHFSEDIYSDRKVMILYLAGHNSLSSYLEGNITDLLEGTKFHTNDEKADAVLIFTHTRTGDGTPYLIYPYRNMDGEMIIDTLMTFTPTTISASAATLNRVLTYIKDNFPADEYGLIFSSHGTGYLPAGYYDYESTYENSYTGAGTTEMNAGTEGKGVLKDPEPVQDRVFRDMLVRSIGSDKQDSGTYEIQLESFADAIPMKLKYVVFDACLLGGIEVAYQLRDKVEWLIASPAEILAAGMDYSTMASYLMARPEDDLAGFCKNYYDYYNAQTGDYQSATISLTNCTRLEPLADLCATLFSKYRKALDEMDYNDIQRYYTYSLYNTPYHWFFDLGDIVEHLGCTAEELAEFNAIMDDCIVYKAATEKYLLSLGGTYITHYSGLSMILPNYAGEYLKNYYRNNIDWNFATSIVE